MTIKYLLEHTGDLAFTQHWVGHADISSTEQYLHLVDSHINAVAQKAFAGMGM